MLDAVTVKEWLLIYAMIGFSMLGVVIYLLIKLIAMVNRLLIESDLVQYLKDIRGR